MRSPDERRRRALGLPVREVSPEDPGARVALTAYVAELDRRFVTVFRAGPTTEAERTMEVTSMTRPLGVLLLVGDDDRHPAACGGLRPIALPGDDVPGRGPTFEVKRMWVHEEWRGSGLGARLLSVLEQRALDLGGTHVVLDTSRALTEAMALYARAGYREIERYNDNPHAQAWYEKRVAPDPGAGPTLSR